LAANTKGGEIAYGVVAGVVAVGYVALVGVRRESAGAMSLRRATKVERDTSSGEMAGRNT